MQPRFFRFAGGSTYPHIACRRAPIFACGPCAQTMPSSGPLSSVSQYSGERLPLRHDLRNLDARDRKVWPTSCPPAATSSSVAWARQPSRPPSNTAFGVNPHKACVRDSGDHHASIAMLLICTVYGRPEGGYHCAYSRAIQKLRHVSGPKEETCGHGSDRAGEKVAPVDSRRILRYRGGKTPAATRIYSQVWAQNTPSSVSSSSNLTCDLKCHKLHGMIDVHPIVTMLTY